MDNIGDDKVISVIFKVEYANGTIRSFSRVNKITKNLKFKNILQSNINNFITLNADHYEDLKIDNSFIEWSISNYTLDHSSWSDIRDIIEGGEISSKIKIENSKISDYSFLPISMDLWTWNRSITFKGGHRFARFTYDNIYFDFNIYKDHYMCTLSSLSDSSIIFKFKDTMDNHLIDLMDIFREKIKCEYLNNYTRIIYKKVDGKWNFEYEKINYIDGVKRGFIKANLDSKFLKFSRRESSPKSNPKVL